MVKHILDELNESNSLNYKRDILQKHKDHELFKRVCQMAYDRVKFTYGITLKNIPEITENSGTFSLAKSLQILEEKFVSREWTGNKAIEEFHTLLTISHPDDRYVIERIIERDLKVNIGRTEMNKVWSNLITKPPYMRCGVLGPKTLKKINFDAGAIVQLKADGTYRSVTVANNSVIFESRSGESSEFPNLEKEYKTVEEGVYIGELLVEGIDNRSEANGLINSDNPPHDKIYMQVWDYISLEEYFDRPKDKKNKTSYTKRLNSLYKNLADVDASRLHVIPTTFVKTIKEAMEHTCAWMKEGYEGSILKDLNNIFIDHTSPTQLKIKLKIDVDVRITGFTEGTKGTKREATFGAITFETDDGKIKGQTSGFSDSQLENYNSRRNELIGSIMSVSCNDIIKSIHNDYYALSHPRFEELRTDKTETDTLERVIENREMAMQVKDYV